MRNKSLTPLGETEMEVLHHVWELGEATVADVRARILDERDIAYTTVMTVMKKLADKGYLAYRKDGRSYVYRPAQSARDVRGNLLGDLIDKVFDGSPHALMLALVQRDDITDDERRALLDLIEDLDDTPISDSNADDDPVA